MSNKKTFIVVLALFALVVAAVPAGAEKPDCDPESPGYTADHPSCDKDEPPGEEIAGGTMCDPAEYPADLRDLDGELIVGVPNVDFTFTLSGKQDDACIDVISSEGPWQVTITGKGARSLGVIPRDSIGPGDSCGGWLLRSTIYDHDASDPLILGHEGSVPAATINACGVAFAEWVDIGLEGLTPDEDCVALDGDLCLVEDQLAVTHPLVLQVFLRGSASGSTTFHVDLPD